MSFSLFQEQPPEETPSDSKTKSEQASEKARAIAHQLRIVGGRLTEKLRSSVPDGRRWNSFSMILAIIAFVALVFGIHEQRVAARLQAQRVEPARALPPGEAETAPAQRRAPETERLAAQINALNAKLDSISHAQPTAQPVAQPPAQRVAKPAPTHARVRHVEVSDVTVIHRVPQQPKPDPRWKKVQDQLDAQSKQIDAQGKQIESTRQEIASARTDLQGSIAKTHEELVVLQKKGERNYYEFNLDKSKSFRSVGPVEVSLRKANTKDQYADLKLIVDDREVSKKHLNLYEPAVFYPSDEHQPLELVINSISKNHIRGYISAAKYRGSELQVGSTGTSPSTSSVPEAATAKARQKLVEAPR
jgi:hypothetical protein